MAKQNNGLKVKPALRLAPAAVGDVLDLVRNRDGVRVSAGGRDRGTVERAAHGEVRRVWDEVEGQRQRVSRTVDTLGTMRKRGEITEAMLSAGLTFQLAFDVAHWQGTPISRYDGMPPSGQGVGGPSLQVLDAIRTTRTIVNRLGGRHGPCAIAIWCVLGLRWSISELAKNQPFDLDDKVWKGTLIGALGILAGELPQKPS